MQGSYTEPLVVGKSCCSDQGAGLSQGHVTWQRYLIGRLPGSVRRPVVGGSERGRECLLTRAQSDEERIELYLQECFLGNCRGQALLSLPHL